MNPPDLCTRSMLNLIRTVPAEQMKPTPPRLIVVTSNGLDRTGHAALPLVYKPMYSFLLKGPHADKIGLERVTEHASGRVWLVDAEQVGEQILPVGWAAGAGERGRFQDVLVVRPALLTDGPCRADAAKEVGKQAYRAEELVLKKAYNVSRRDVAHFIAEQALKDWDRWNGKCVCIAY